MRQTNFVAGGPTWDPELTPATKLERLLTINQEQLYDSVAWSYVGFDTGYFWGVRGALDQTEADLDVALQSQGRRYMQKQFNFVVQDLVDTPNSCSNPAPLIAGITYDVPDTSVDCTVKNWHHYSCTFNNEEKLCEPGTSIRRDGYNTNARGWYSSVRSALKPQWSTVYPFFGTTALGISYTIPVVCIV